MLFPSLIWQDYQFVSNILFLGRSSFIFVSGHVRVACFDATSTSNCKSILPCHHSCKMKFLTANHFFNNESFVPFQTHAGIKMNTRSERFILFVEFSTMFILLELYFDHVIVILSESCGNVVDCPTWLLFCVCICHGMGWVKMDTSIMDTCIMDTHIMDTCILDTCIMGTSIMESWICASWIHALWTRASWIHTP